MDKDELSTGQTVKYLFKSGGKDTVIEARIIGFNGSETGIEFRHGERENSFLHRRWLSSANVRRRLSFDGVFPEIRRGAPEGNVNARKDAGGRVSVPLSIGNERRAWAVSKLQEQGIGEPTPQQIARFIKDFCYQKIDDAVESESKECTV